MAVALSLRLDSSNEGGGASRQSNEYARATRHGLTISGRAVYPHPITGVRKEPHAGTPQLRGPERDRVSHMTRPVEIPAQGRPMRDAVGARC